MHGAMGAKKRAESTLWHRGTRRFMATEAAAVKETADDVKRRWLRPLRVPVKVEGRVGGNGWSAAQGGRSMGLVFWVFLATDGILKQMASKTVSARRLVCRGGQWMKLSSKVFLGHRILT